jgi:hypothetical protein
LPLKELQENAPAYIPFEYHKHERGLFRPDGSPSFATPTGRIELWSNFYNNAGLDPLPYFEEPSPGPGATPELLEEYPLVLTTGARNPTLFHSEHRQIKHLRAVHPDPLVQINPATAQKYGVKDGDWVWLENQMGRCKRRVSETPIVNEQTISIDHGWWFPEGDPGKLFDVFDLNVNQLFKYIPGKAGLTLLGSLMGLFATSTAMFLASRVLEGFGMGMISVIGPNVMPRLFPLKNQGLVMGIWSLWVPMGSMIAFLTTPLLYGSFGWTSLIQTQ